MQPIGRSAAATSTIPCPDAAGPLEAALRLVATACGADAAGMAVQAPEGVRVVAVHGDAVVWGADIRGACAAALHGRPADPVTVAGASAAVAVVPGAAGRAAVAVVRPGAPFSAAERDDLVTFAAMLADSELVSPGTPAGGTFSAARLHRALEDGEFLPYFQPVVDLATGRARGFEALMRWRHPEEGVLSIRRFIAALASCGLELAVGGEVLREAMRHFARLTRERPGRLTELAVNVSSAQLARPGLARVVLEALEATGLPGTLLTVEVSEAARIARDAPAAAELAALRDAGVRVAIDDFGVLHSSLARIVDLPVTDLKLDREVVTRLPGDARAWAVARATLAVAAELGLGVVAEGVERLDQQAGLRELGCRFGQGHLFCRPLPPAALGHYLAVQDGAPARPAPSGATRGWFAGRETLPRLDDPSPHLVAFHGRDEVLAEQVADFLHPVRADGAALLIVGETFARSVQPLLAGRVDLEALRAERRCLVLDAHDTVARVTSSRGPDPRRFREHLGTLVASLAERHGLVHVYAETTAVLWEAGDGPAALALEDLWEDLGMRTSFLLFCGLPQRLRDAPGGDRLRHVCDRHRAQYTG